MRTRKNTPRRFPVEVLTPEEAVSLIKTCSAKASTGLRNRALLTVLYRAGLRIAEALALRLKDVNVEAGTLTVLHGKGDRRRVVGLDAGAAAVLGQWLERRTALGLNGRHFVFCTLKGQPEWEAKIDELMEAVDSFVPRPDRAVDLPFLMPIEDIFSISGRGTVVTGRIERGKVKVGEDVEIVGFR